MKISKMSRRISRRSFLGVAGAGAASLMLPRLGHSAVGSRVVVVGGGFAGSTAAKYLRMWSGGAVEVVLVEQNPSHVSCVMSNLVLNNSLRLSSLDFSYAALSDRYGVHVLEDKVDEIEASRATVRLQNGGDLSYDRLILAPGVAFEDLPGWDPNTVPHAWKAGAQTLLLRDQIRDMPDDGTFVMTIPEAPYRCPPGPYERACLVADILGRRSGIIGNGPRTGGVPKVVVLDANPAIQAERETFSRAFDTLYKDIVDYRTDVSVEAVDSPNRIAITAAGDEVRGDVLNVIPRHKAPILGSSGFEESQRWIPVNPLTYESTVPALAGVHVIGDSQGTGQPKSGHMANAQAKVCSDAVLRLLAGEPVDTAERVANITTNSACYSPITQNEASWLTAVFAYDPTTASMKLAGQSLGEAGRWTTGNYRDMFRWSENLFADTFS